MRLRNEQGMALVMALIMLVVLGMVGVVVMTYTTSGQRTASRESAGLAAYSLAEAGINNAISVLANPANDAGQQSLLPSSLGTANTSTYDSGYVKWFGTYDTSTYSWLLTSIGYVRNPAGTRDVTRRITVPIYAREKPQQFTATEVWNYIIATRTGTPGGCDETLSNSVNIQSPLYVVGNLCLNTPSQITGGPLQVHGAMKLDVNTNVGSAVVPLNQAHVKNGCAYKNAVYVSPCTPTQQVWASVVDSSPITLNIPTANFARWYLRAAPGPRQGCTTQSGTVPVFDNNTTFDNSVPTTFNIVPPSTSYSCVVKVGNTTVGELSWNHTTKVLTINGTVFIDGSVTASYGYSNVPVEYVGTGTIYAAGTILFSNTQLCATITAANDSCDFPTWQPNDRFLVFVADGSGGNGQQVPTGDSIQLVSSSLEGGLFATNAIEVNTSSKTEGPMLAGTEIIGQTTFARTWPIIKAPAGMPTTTEPAMTIDPPGGFAG